MTRRSGLWVPPATAAWMRASHLSQAGDVDLLDSSVVRYLDASTAKGAGGARSQGVKWWRDLARQWGIAECQALSVFASRADQLRVESFLMRYAVWLVDVRQTQVETARKYYEVNSWHAFEHGEFTPGYGIPRLGALFKGMSELVPAPPRVRRRAVRTQCLALGLQRCFPRGPDADVANVRAALQVGFCGLLRAAEYSLQAGEAFVSRRHLTRSDVTFEFVDGQRLPVSATVMMRPCKKLRYAGAKTVPVYLQDGDFLRPVAALWDLFQFDPVPDEALSSTALFRFDGVPFSTAFVRSLVRMLMESVGEDPFAFGAHSLRIGGATAALAAGIPPVVIKVMGRWDSEIYEIYTRMSQEAARRAGVLIASTAFVDIEGEFSHEELFVSGHSYPAF